MELKAVQETEVKAWQRGWVVLKEAFFTWFVQQQLVEDP